MSLADQLQEGLAALGLELSAATQSMLLRYVALLKKWNATYNLTAIRDEKDMVTQHLLDSLSLLPTLENSALVTRRWADVGSGAGLPGIPLAIARPDFDMTLVEAVEKKSAFQRQARIELGLANVTVHGGRVEDMAGGSFAAVVSRAFADLADFVNLTAHLAGPETRILAMKGVYPADEIARIPAGFALERSTPLTVPGLDAERHLIIVKRSKN